MRIELISSVPQTDALTTRLTTQGSRWNQTTDEKGMSLLLYHWTILPTEVVGFEPTVPITRHGILAGFCNKPLCHTSNVVLKQPIRVLCCLKATSGNNWTWTSGLSIISRMLYQLSYVSKAGTIGFEPITPCSSNKCSTNWSYVPKYSWRDLNPRLCLERASS